MQHEHCTIEGRTMMKTNALLFQKRVGAALLALLALLVCMASARVARSAPIVGVGVGLNFTSSTFRENSFFIPPDTMGAVSGEHIVELINGRYAVYRKSDGVLL